MYGGINLLQLGRDWWWNWTETNRTELLTIINNGNGWRAFNEQQKKDWKRYNKELWLLMEPLCKELTAEEVRANKVMWIGLSAKHIKQFISTVPTHDALPDYVKHLILNANRNVADALACVCMYYLGLLDEWIKIKQAKGYQWYYDYFFNNDKYDIKQNKKGAKNSKT